MDGAKADRLGCPRLSPITNQPIPGFLASMQGSRLVRIQPLKTAAGNYSRWAADVKKLFPED